MITPRIGGQGGKKRRSRGSEATTERGGKGERSESGGASEQGEGEDASPNPRSACGAARGGVPPEGRGEGGRKRERNRKQKTGGGGTPPPPRRDCKFLERSCAVCAQIG